MKNKIQSLHNELVGKSLDTSTLAFWATSIMKGSQSIDDFIEFVINTDDYKKNTDSQFKYNYFMYVDYDLSETTLSNFHDYAIKKIKETQTSMNESDIHAYISQLDTFIEKYTYIVKTVYNLKYSSECPGEICRKYVDKFATNPLYNIDLLENEIDNSEYKTTDTNVADVADAEDVSTVETVARQVDKSHDFRLSYVNATNEMPSDNDMIIMQNMSTNIDKLVEIFVASKQVVATVPIPPQKTYDDIELERFQAAFQRPMYVQEYYKYVINNENEQDRIEDYGDLKEMHDANFNHMRQLVQLYTNVAMEELDFIKKYLDKIDNSRFFVDFVDTIIISIEYEINQKTSINSRYKRMFDEDLESHDTNFIFNKVKLAKLSLVDDAIEQMLTAFKSDTDDIITHVFEKYISVLERQPDIFEITKWVEVYRHSDIGFDQQDDVVEAVLMKSLEFHDILKKRIRALYSEKKGSTILPSILYNILDVVLPTLENIKLGGLNDMICKEF